MDQASTLINLATIDRPYLVEGRNLIMFPANGDYDKIIPSAAKLAVIKGHPFYITPHTPAINVVLAQAGYPLPSPIFFDGYDWSNIQIYAAQAEMAGLLVCRQRSFNLSEMGAGKTIGTLLAIDWLICNGYIERCLVIAPLSILWTVWYDTVIENFPRLQPLVLHGTAEKRKELLDRRNWNVGIINHDGVRVMHRHLADLNVGMVVIDEASAFRDVGSKRWKLLNPIITWAPYAVALTGSLAPNSPSDAYGIGRLFLPHVFKMSATQFKKMVEYEAAPGQWLPKPGAEKIIHSMLQPAVRFKRSDIVQLEGRTVHEHHVDLSSKQTEALKKLKAEAIVKYPEGIVDAVNAAVLVGKLLQICGGAVYTSDRAIVDLEPKHRMETLRTIVESTDSKIIVPVPFIHTTHIVADELRKVCQLAVVNGEVAARDRTVIFRRFQDKRDPLRVLVVHPKVIAHGLNLTAANIIVWWSGIHSLEQYEQLNARIDRLGQVNDQYIMHLCSKTAEERAVYRVLERKGSMQDVIMSMFDTVLN